MTAPIASTTPDPRIGLTLAGRYALHAPLGAGSMGTVYRATQLAVEREVAVKIVNGDKSFDPAANARFMREARANSLLASPHTVQVLDFGQSETGELFLVMELLEGESLRRRLARLGRFPADMAIETSLGALRSLAEAHAKGVIHRDLKPEHLFFARVTGEKQQNEIVKVLDFGVAKLLGDEGKRLNAIETRDGRILGTPRYMSPEQAQAKPLDARSDLYSVAVILYEMLTGRAPFTSEDPIVVMAQHITKTPRAPSEACPEACVPRDLEDVLMRALSKHPASRPANAEAMAEELSALLESGLASVNGVRRAARISVAPKSMQTTANAGPGTSGGVVVSRSRGDETLPTGDLEPEIEPETIEMRRGRSRRGVAAAIAVAFVIGGGVSAFLLRRDRGDMPAAATAPPAASTVPMATTVAPVTLPVAAAAQPSSISVDALPSAASPSRARKPGAKPLAPRPSSSAPPSPPSRPTKGYDYLE